MDTKQSLLSEAVKLDGSSTGLTNRSPAERTSGSKPTSKSTSESQSKELFEVQTYTLCDGWVNCWTIEDEKKEYFDTEQEAEDAICEFFADLGRAGMAQAYDKEEYRVRKVHVRGS